MEGEKRLSGGGGFSRGISSSTGGRRCTVSPGALDALFDEGSEVDTDVVDSTSRNPPAAPRTYDTIAAFKTTTNGNASSLTKTRRL